MAEQVVSEMLLGILRHQFWNVSEDELIAIALQIQGQPPPGRKWYRRVSEQSPHTQSDDSGVFLPDVARS